MATSKTESGLPGPGKPRGGPQKSENKNRTALVIMAVAIVFLLAGLGYFVIQSNSQQEDIASLEGKQDQLMKEIESLENEIEDKDLELSAGMQENEELKKSLQDLQARIQSYQYRINKALKEQKITEQARAELEQKAKSLDYYNEQYKAKIAELEEKIKNLENANQELERARNEQEQQIEEITRERDLQRNKISAAEQLRASQFDFFGVKSNGKEMDPRRDGTVKASRSDALKVCFTLDENPIAQNGQHELYMVVKSPSGKVYNNMGGGSGYFELDGSEKVYSAKKVVNYANKRQKVCMVYDMGGSGEFDVGRHKVNIYGKTGNKKTYAVGEYMLELR